MLRLGQIHSSDGLVWAAVAAPSVSNNSRGKAIQEEQLLPKVIEYDPVTGQPVNAQIERVDGRKQTT